MANFGYVFLTVISANFFPKFHANELKRTLFFISDSLFHCFINKTNIVDWQIKLEVKL